MLPLKNITITVFCCICFIAGHTQHRSKVPSVVTSLFDDLPIDDPATNSILQRGEDGAEKIKNNIFVTTTVSKRRCFLGEPILLTCILYSALQSTSKINASPSLAGFSTREIKLSNEEVKRKKQNGKTFRVFTIQQVALTPLQEGVLTIEPIAVFNEVSYKTESNEEKQYSGTVKSTEINITVDSLPVAGRAPGFEGALGNFSIEAMAGTIQAAGENNRLTIDIKGEGNFESLNAPAIDWPPGCEHFSDLSPGEIQPNTFPASGTQHFTFTFIPAKEGLFVIPPVQLVFFDPQKKTYRTVYSKPVTVHVSKALNKPKPVVAKPLQDKKALEWYYWLLGAVLCIGLIGWFFYRKKKSAGEK